MSESPPAELDRLRSEVESYRRRELEQLQARLAEALQLVEHYRTEAHRNADLGRQINAQATTEINSLRSQLETLRNADAHTKRFGG